MDERAELEKVVNDKSRRIKIRGNTAIVPLKFDEDGNPATVDRLIFKRLSLIDLRFLGALRKESWDFERALKLCHLEREPAVRLLKKLTCFREEDARVKALCEIPTPEWIAAKHVQNIYEGGQLDDSSHKSLQELAKIEGAYKNNLNVSVTQNVFNLPHYDPATEAKLKDLADREAIIVQEAEVVNG